MQLCQFFSHGNGDGRHVDVDRALKHLVEHAICDEYIADGVIVGQHGKEDVDLGRLGSTGNGGGAGANQLLGVRPIAAPDQQRQLGLEQVGGHGHTHGAEADKSDSHEVLPYRCKEVEGWGVSPGLTYRMLPKLDPSDHDCAACLYRLCSNS